MTVPPVRIGLIGNGPVVDAYAAAGPPAGAELIRAAADPRTSPDFTGVIVASAHGALDAIAHGTPVLVDPAAIADAGQLDRIRTAAVTASVPLAVARPWRCHEVTARFHAAVAAGELGPPAFFHWVDEGAAGWQLGAGPAAGDAASALVGIDLALWLLGARPERVYARRTGSGVTVSLRCLGGANALIERRPGIAGGGAGFGFAWLLGPRGEVRWNRGADGLAISGGERSTLPLDLGACLRAQVAAAVAHWSGGGEPGPDLDQVRQVLRTIAAANDSARLGQPVAVAGAEEGREG